MPFRSLMSSLALAAVAVAAPIAAPQAHAQGLFEFLWGGGQEWGGGKQTVAFDQKYTAGQIIVSFGDRRLYLIEKAGTAMSYPIAVPREQSRWQGTTTVTDKRANPSWRPTPDMLRENPKLPLWVPGGHRMNPLGVRAMYLGSSLYRIHGTDAPWTIGQAVSKGCIRMLNEDVLDLYPRVPVGTKVTVTWQRFGDQAVAYSEDQGSAPPAVEQASVAGYKTPPRSMRPRTPSAAVEAANAGEATDAMDIDPSAATEQLAAAAEQPLEPKPVKKAEKKHTPVAAVAPPAAPAQVAPAHTAPAHVAPKEDAVAIAERAAATATKAAEAARAAADAAKKAAEDAKRATTGEAGKSAAL